MGFQEFNILIDPQMAHKRHFLKEWWVKILPYGHPT